MRKKNLRKPVLVLLLCVTFFFIGCGSKTMTSNTATENSTSEVTEETLSSNDIGSDTEEITENENELQVEASDSSEDISMDELTDEPKAASTGKGERLYLGGYVCCDDYQSILDEVYALIMDHENYHDYWCPLVGLLEEFGYYYTYDNPVLEEVLSTVGYTYMDLDEDGSDELLIAANDDIDNNIFGIFAMKDGKAILIQEGWGRNQLHLLNGNIIYNLGILSWDGTLLARYKLDPKTKELVNMDTYVSEYLFDEEVVAWFYNETGTSEIEKSTRTDMTAEEGEALIDKYWNEIVTLDLNYFAGYTPSGK